MEHDDDVYTKQVESSLDASVFHTGEYSNHAGHPCNQCRHSQHTVHVKLKSRKGKAMWTKIKQTKIT